ncbi:MAG: 16S rRNA (guanine(527)-N(7))-methyltransferase RsmG [Alphaproteobacteria bacterium]|nr:16S rRNA (guanine(527)-N(7))-methyltransferase RsmG [Alphaproteobacteria bacterium]
MKNNVKFEQYAQLLREWSGRMNLVAPSTLNDIENRHFADSAQLADILPKGVPVVDLGSGAGFPGVVLAILGWNVMCIESIGKKVAFLSAVKEKLGLDNLTIYHGRVEDFVRRLPAKNDDFVFTARAFASLEKIMDYVAHTKRRLFLLKGREIPAEINVAKQRYKFDFDLTPSKTGDGFIISVRFDR